MTNLSPESQLERQLRERTQPPKIFDQPRSSTPVAPAPSLAGMSAGDLIRAGFFIAMGFGVFGAFVYLIIAAGIAIFGGSVGP